LPEIGGEHESRIVRRGGDRQFEEREGIGIDNGRGVLELIADSLINDFWRFRRSLRRSGSTLDCLSRAPSSNPR